MTNDMKMVLLIGLLILTVIGMALIYNLFKKNDFEKAQVACGNKLAAFQYEYIPVPAVVKPRFTCK